MKPHPWKCGTCRERAVVPFTLPVYQADLEHDGRKYSVTLANVDVYRCDACGAIMLPDDVDEKLSHGLRVAAGLLPPAEIRRHREALGLTQKQMAEHLQISDSTLSRWETGAQIQQRSFDRSLRAYFSLPEYRHFLSSYGNASPSAFAQSFESTIASQRVADWIEGAKRVEQEISQSAHSLSGTPKPKLRMAS